MSWNALQEFLKENPNKEQFIGSAPSIGDPMRLGRKKTDSAYRDKVQAIKKHNRGSTIQTGNLSAV